MYTYNATRVLIRPPSKSGGIAAILLIRNEELIIQDSLDHLSTIADWIYVYDDASTDNTCEICAHHPSVAGILRNEVWHGGSAARLQAETAHRNALLTLARELQDPEWIICADADERFVGRIGEWLRRDPPSEVSAVKVRFFDAYLTPIDRKAIKKGDSLCNARKYFGPEVRTIICIFRNIYGTHFTGFIAREPTLPSGRIITKFACQHYGKAISEDQWNDTCDYYFHNFPFRTYGKKWLPRKNNAIHLVSDFGETLHPWGKKLIRNSVPLRDAESLAIRPLRILLTINHFFSNTGAETQLATTANMLSDRGHKVTLFSPNIAASFASKSLLPSVRWTGWLEEISDSKFDVAHVMHANCAILVRAAFPRLPIIYSSLGIIPFLESPPTIDSGISRYLAVSEEVADFLTTKGVGRHAISIFRNPVSASRFDRLQPISEKQPHKFLVISNRIPSETLRKIERVAKALGADLTVAGAPSNQCSQEELAELINRSDLVFGIGRGVIESMLCGRAVYVFDYLGADGMVTPKNYHTLRSKNFSGRTLRSNPSEEEILEEIRLYYGKSVDEIRLLAVQDFSIELKAEWLEQLYEECINDQIPEYDKPALDFAATLIREQAQWAHVLRQREVSYQLPGSSAENENLERLMVANYKRILDLSRHSEYPDTTTTEYDAAQLELARKIDIGRLHEAFEALEELIRLKPENSIYLQLLAQISLKTEDSISAINFAKAALSKAPNVAVNHFLLASAYSLTGDYPLALMSLSRAIALAPDHPEYRNMLRSLLNLETSLSFVEWTEFFSNIRRPSSGQRLLMDFAIEVKDLLKKDLNIQ